MFSPPLSFPAPFVFLGEGLPFLTTKPLKAAMKYVDVSSFAKYQSSVWLGKSREQRQVV